MGALSLDNELFQYWSKLSVEKKETLISFAKNLADSSDEVTIPEHHWALILKEREAHYNGTKGYTWEEVKEMARDKMERHGRSYRPI